ncbi:UNVERIFIED_CONTAM: hypothetical protein Sradi_7304000 [Sesamum radiatum]|uniref:MULE transposase domain-containing protein n=1 Tax=Sesamum radiatum TaxID=300843 RepID=A0AAW2I797_SESRA
MVKQRLARHVSLPPPQYHPETDSITLSVHYDGLARHVPEGMHIGVGEHNDSGEGDELVDSDFDEEIGIVRYTNVEEINDQRGNVGLEEEVVRESSESCGSSDDEEEEDVVDNDGDLDEYRDSDEDKYLQKFKSDPKRCVKGFRVDIINELRVNVFRHQAYRAKKVALKQLEGSPEWQYSRLWDYSKEIRRTNTGSNVIVGTEQVDGEEMFSRFYVRFGTLKAGFKAGCRPIIGVDGCHLKGPNGGILLTAIGVDPNNNLFPIAHAVVNKECRETWEWFLIILKHDLNIIRQHEYTFMSDKQKGLMQAFEEVFPGCDREWKKRMQEINTLSQQAFDWFNDKPAVQWSRSHFSEASSCDMLLNNSTLCGSCSAIYHQKKDPEDYVADCYSVDMYRRVYKPAILPMSHEGLWSVSCIIPPLPPNFGRGAGRPAKARRRESDKPTLKNKKKSRRKQVLKLRRHPTTVHCRTCGEPRHNTAMYPERVPVVTQEMTEATINMEGTNVRARKRKALGNAGNRIERIGEPQLEHKVLTFSHFCNLKKTPALNPLLNHVSHKWSLKLQQLQSTNASAATIKPAINLTTQGPNSSTSTYDWHPWVTSFFYHTKSTNWKP